MPSSFCFHCGEEIRRRRYLKKEIAAIACQIIRIERPIERPGSGNPLLACEKCHRLLTQLAQTRTKFLARGREDGAEVREDNPAKRRKLSHPSSSVKEVRLCPFVVCFPCFYGVFMHPAYPRPGRPLYGSIDYLLM